MTEQTDIQNPDPHIPETRTHLIVTQPKVVTSIDGQMAALGTTGKPPYPNPAQPMTNRVSANPTRCIGSCLGLDSNP